MSPRPDEIFAAACGLTRPWKIVVSRPGYATCQHIFEQPFVVVGRAEGSSLRLDDPDVSGRHAYLQVLPQGLLFVDLGSRAGTVVRGERRDHCWVRPGEFMHIGPFVLETAPVDRHDGVPPWDPLVRPPEDYPTLPMVAAAVHGDGGKEVGRWRMNAVVALVGTSPRCKARMFHPSVSGFHCVLVRTPVGVWVIDLLSRHGTVLNDQCVQCEQVRDCDRLQLGEFIVRMRLRSQAVAPLEQPVGTTTFPVVQIVPAPLPEGGSFALTGLAPTTGLTPLAEPGAAEVVLPASVLQQFGRIQQQLFEQFHRDLEAMAGLFLRMHHEHMATITREMADLRRLTEEIQRLQAELRTQTQKRRLGAPKSAARTKVSGPTERTPEAVPTLSNGPPERKETVLSGAEPRAGEDIHAWLNQRIASLTTEHDSRWQRLLGMITGK